MSLGVKLRQLRQNKNWSQQDIAHRLNISQPAYNKWETDMAKPNMNNLAKLSEILEVDIYELLDGTFSQTNTDNKNSAISIFGNPIVNNNFPEDLLTLLLTNQKKIAELVESQSKVIDSLLKNH